jgi:AmmeMemoRadiSam system protein B
LGNDSVVALVDPAGLMSGPVVLSASGFRNVVQRFDGSQSLADIQMRILFETGQWVSQDSLHALVDQLETAGAIEGPTWSRLHALEREASVRAPALAGRAYPDEPANLRELIDGFHAQSGGSPQSPQPAAGIVSPHIDFERGGLTYARAYRPFLGSTDADVFIVLGVAHQYCRTRFALTRKDFATPLGVIPTNRALVDQIAEAVGDDVFNDEIAHRTEHSIEFQTIFLRHGLARNREFSIVPILVGSFHDHVAKRTSPISDPQIARMIEAIRSIVSTSQRRAALIAGIDLCHVGPDFGDRVPVDDAQCAEVRRFDQKMLAQAAAGDAEGWFQTASAVGDRYRVCGLAATYVFLHALNGRAGRLLDYHQALSANRRCLVTVAGMSFPAD